MHTYPCVHVVRPICLKIPSNLLHMELTRTKVHKYDFPNRYGLPLHVHVVQMWITAMKWLENHLNVFEKVKWHQKFSKISHDSCISARYT